MWQLFLIGCQKSGQWPQGMVQSVQEDDHGVLAISTMYVQYVNSEFVNRNTFIK